MIHDPIIPFEGLRGHKYMSLTTYRQTGKPVATPVWFAQEGDRLYVTTLATSGKVKRLRNNSQVEVAPCDVRGALLGGAVKGAATILNDAADAARANRALNRKYGITKRLFDLAMRLRRAPITYLEITPM